jgi:hypothetical protein
MRRRALWLTVVAIAIGLGSAGTASAAITPVTKNAAGALALATAMNNNAVITGATFQTVPPSNNPNGTANAALNEFPTNGTTFSILTSGCVEFADDANDAPNTTCSDGGGTPTGRGNSAFDVTVLAINFTVPTGSNCATFQFKFFSEEFPEFVGTSFNDAFIAELDTSNWTTSGSTITAPNNFAFDQNGNVISINAAGAATMNAAEATGTTYDGATQLLQASKQAAAGAHTLFLSIFDQGDSALDSAVFLDNLRVGFAANPQTQCQPGAVPVEDCTDGVDNDGDGLVDGKDPDCDKTSPSCQLTKTGTDATGKKFIEVTTQDTGSGILSIVVDKSTNATTVVPPFTPGTNNAVVVRATKINQSLGSTVQLTVTDVAGNKTTCDPVIHVEVREAGKPSNATYTGLPQAESKVRITNGSPGLRRVDVIVNGTTWRVTGLRNGQVSTFDVASAMKPGTDNTIRIMGYGAPGADALVVISDV